MSIDAIPLRIEQGYMICVHTWENDGDNPQEKQLEGLTQPHAKLVFNLISILQGSLGNEYEPSEGYCRRLARAVRLVVEHTQNDLDVQLVKGLPDKDDDYVLDFFFDMTTDLTGSGEFYTRKVKDVKVFYVPFAVEFPDVTDQFTNQQ